MRIERLKDTLARMTSAADALGWLADEAAERLPEDDTARAEMIEANLSASPMAESLQVLSRIAGRQ